MYIYIYAIFFLLSGKVKLTAIDCLENDAEPLMITYMEQQYVVRASCIFNKDFLIPL